MLKTLRGRMVMILTLLITAVMLVVGTFLLSSVSTFYHDEFQRQLGQVLGENSDLILAVEEVSGQTDSQQQAYEMYERVKAFFGQLGVDADRNVYILDGKTGAYLIGTDPEQGQRLARTTNMLAVLGGETVGRTVHKADDYMDYAVALQTVDGHQYVLYVKDNKEELQTMIWMLFIIIIQALFVGLIIAVGMSFFMAKAISNPIENLTRGANQVASGQFDYQLPVVSKDELGTLTRTFNQMAGALKNSMEEIEEEKNKLSTIFLYLTDGVIAFAKDGQMLHINAAARQMLGLSEEESFSFGRLFADFYIDVDFGQILSLAPGDNFTKEVTVSGRILRMVFAHFDVDTAGTAEQNALGGGIIIVLQDITEQRKFEDSRKEFVANVSHELRTPLTSVKSYTETVLENPDLPPAMVQKFLGVVLYETDRMTKLVKDLLILSRLDNHKIEWVFQEFSLKKLLENIYDSTLMDARNHSHTLTMEVAEDLQPICGDKDRLEQVIINIVSNAIKYTPDGGEISLRAENRGDQVAIHVDDNGIGIPKEDVPRLFERFYRVDKARSRERGGTGLGLAIAREIVLAHHGHIEVESELEKGTKVTILLPCRQESLVQEVQPPKQEKTT